MWMTRRGRDHDQGLRTLPGLRSFVQQCGHEGGGQDSRVRARLGPRCGPGAGTTTHGCQKKNTSQHVTPPLVHFFCPLHPMAPGHRHFCIMNVMLPVKPMPGICPDGGKVAQPAAWSQPWSMQALRFTEWISADIHAHAHVRKTIDTLHISASARSEVRYSWLCPVRGRYAEWLWCNRPVWRRRCSSHRFAGCGHTAGTSSTAPAP